MPCKLSHGEGEDGNDDVQDNVGEAAAEQGDNNDASHEFDDMLTLVVLVIMTRSKNNRDEENGLDVKDTVADAGNTDCGYSGSGGGDVLADCNENQDCEHDDADDAHDVSAEGVGRSSRFDDLRGRQTFGS